jgi:hypothetical protein
VSNDDPGPTASTACPKAESEFVKNKVEQASLVWAESLGREIFAERLEECIKHREYCYVYRLNAP